MTQNIPLGTVELTTPQITLINRFAVNILEGPVEYAKDSFGIIFDRYPEDEIEMQVFKKLCETAVEGNLV